MTQPETITTRDYSYTAVFERAEEGGFVVTFPAIPNLATQGETLDKARRMAADCLQGYLEWLQEDGEPLPAPDGPPVTEPARTIWPNRC